MSQTGKAVVEVKGETKKFVMSKDGIEVVVALRALCGLESIELNTSAVWITIHQAENVLWDQELAALQKAA